MNWSELNRFSKALLLIMGAFVIAYLVRELIPSGTTEHARTPRSQLGLVRTESEPLAPAQAKNEAKLVESLKSPTSSVRDQATSTLWKLWQEAAGPDAERRLQAGLDMLASGHPLAAVDQFSKLVADYPEFAEAYNKRAIAYFSMGDYEPSIQDCLKATGLNQNHFGAWSGLGQCYLAIRRYDLALNAFERALALQPFSEENKSAVEFCKEKRKNMLPHDLNDSA